VSRTCSRTSARRRKPFRTMGISVEKAPRPRWSRKSAGVVNTGATAILCRMPTTLPRTATMRLRPRMLTILPRMTPMRLRPPPRMVTIPQRMATTVTIRPRMASMATIRPRMATDHPRDRVRVRAWRFVTVLRYRAEVMSGTVVPAARNSRSRSTFSGANRGSRPTSRLALAPSSVHLALVADWFSAIRRVT
jgi:hypothetical protein